MNKLQSNLNTIHTKLALSAVFLAVLSGCATKMPPPAPIAAEFPDSAYVVAKDLPQSIARSEKRINDNFALLNDLENKRTMSPAILNHNQGLDARSPDDKRRITGPQFPGNPGNQMQGMNPANPSAVMSGANKPTSGPIKGEDASKVAKFNVPLKSVEWQNSPLNDFIKQIANHVGYELEINQNGKFNNTNLNLREYNKTTLQILEKVAQTNKDILEMTVSHSRQKIIINYK